MKCPNCGGDIKSSSFFCEYCGTKIERDTSTDSLSISEFSKKMDEIERHRKNSWFSLNISTATDARKAEFIKNYPLPENEQELLDFMVFACSNVNTDNSVTPIDQAWLAKIKQIKGKSEFSNFSNDTKSKINKLYNECFIKIKKSKWRDAKIGLIVFALLIVGLYLTSYSVKVDNKREETRLNSLISDISSALDEGEYENALYLADSIDYTGYDKNRKIWWNAKKEQLLKSIVKQADDDGISLKMPENKTDTTDQ